MIVHLLELQYTSDCNGEIYIAPCENGIEYQDGFCGATLELFKHKQMSSFELCPKCFESSTKTEKSSPKTLTLPRTTAVQTTTGMVITRK